MNSDPLLVTQANISGYTLIEKDHLGDCSPEKDCC